MSYSSHPEKDDDILRARIAGDTYKTIADRYGMSVEGVRSSCRKTAEFCARWWPNHPLMQDAAEYLNARDNNMLESKRAARANG